MRLDKEELEMIGRAVGKAHEAFDREISADGTDPAYYHLTVTVKRVGGDFETALAQVSYEDFG